MTQSKRILPIICLSLATLASGQLPVRNAVSNGGSSPALIADGIPSTAWTSGGSGTSASLLFDDPLAVEAAYVMASGSGGSAGYQLLGSSNYRDWILLSDGIAAPDIESGEVLGLAPQNVHYLRVLSQSDGAFQWELLAGTATQVNDQILTLRPVDWGDITDPEVIAHMLDVAFDWQIANPTTNQEGTGWVTGAFYTGISGLLQLTQDPKYRQAIIDIGTDTNWILRLRTSAKTFYHADDHCLGQSWLDLYLNDPNPKAIWYTDVKKRLDMVMANPLQGRVDMNWCDALYMSPPNYVRLAEITGDNSYRTFIDTQWWDVSDFLYDQQYKLFYRDSSYFDDVEPNGKPVFWSRGNGWVIGGLVRLLQHMPADWPRRADYISQLEEMSAALAVIQGEDGLWSGSLLYPEKYDMERETSGSAFFTYAMAWGVNEGILEEAVYGPVIEKAWSGLSAMLNANGTINFIQQVGAGPALNNGVFINKDYGYGAFLLAGTEMIRYYTGKQPAARYRQLSASVMAANADPQAWTKVEDFEQPFGWSIEKAVPQSEVLLQDPHDPEGSHVFSINTGNRTSGYYRATTLIPAIPNGSTATVYQRFAFNNPEIDVLFGISDLAVVDAYPDYENGLRIYFDFNQMEARSGTTYIPIGDDLLQLNTWYEAWTVINNASDTYDVYLRGGSNYPQQVLLKSGIPFRNGTTASIISYAISYNTQYCEGTFYMDDIYVDSGGVNLARPAGVHQPAYSPWSDIGRQPPGMVKSTPIGTLWDEQFPWIYHVELGGWSYVQPQDVYPGGYYAWRTNPAGWVWISAAWPGWYYDYATAGWALMD